MRNIIFWIGPPIIGAAIGYITNIVAIKMLFRPLKEVRFLGKRLPFTPGIFPRERHKLADSIGRMVEQELITSEVLRERLAKPEVRENIKNTLSGYSGQLLDRPLSSWLEGRPEDSPFTDIINDFVNSTVFDSFLEEFIKTWMSKSSSDEDNSVTSWLKSRLRDLGYIFVPPARDIIKSGLVREMKNPRKVSVYRQAMERIIEKYPGITLRDFISIGERKKQKVDLYLADKTADTLDENIEGALSSVDVKTLVSDRINSLDMIKVERIILDIMAGQLKWIHFFGAGLGALIGFSQVLLSLLTG
jgi:uncharacterized membrane protein YheB (UPF0754 family)